MKIKHQIVEHKEYIFPVFFSIMTLFFLFGISLLIIDMGDWIFSFLSIPIIWIIFAFIIIKNDLWRPKKIKYVEHIIIEDKNGKKKRRKKNSTRKRI